MAKRTAKPLHLPLIIEQDEDGVYIVSCPTLKGCHSYGHTIEKAIDNIKEVIEMCLEENKPDTANNFIGFRDLLIPA